MTVPMCQCGASIKGGRFTTYYVGTYGVPHSVCARGFAALAIHPLYGLGATRDLGVPSIISKQWHRLACPRLARALSELNLMPVLRNPSSERRHECLNLA